MVKIGIDQNKHFLILKNRKLNFVEISNWSRKHQKGSRLQFLVEAHTPYNNVELLFLTKFSNFI